MNRTKILLLVPPGDARLIMERSRDVNEAFGTYPPLGLLYIAAYAKQELGDRVDIRITDGTVEPFSEDGLESLLDGFSPDLVGMTAFTPSLLDVKTTLEAVKRHKPSCVSVLGGPHVTTFRADALSLAAADYAIMGYGEHAFVQLIRALAAGGPLAEVPGLLYRENGRVMSNRVAAEVQSLDDLPFPDLTMVPYTKYRCPVGTRDVMASLISSRGCPFHCTFCNSPDKIYRKRSMANVIEEVTYVQGLGINEIFFHDDLFNVNNERVYEFCRQLDEHRLRITWSFKSRVTGIDEDFVRTIKAHGCERIHFGIETHTDEGLKALKKGITVDQIRKACHLCHTHKINSVGSFMINIPGDTVESIRERLDFAASLKLDYFQLAVLIAFNHTEIFQDGVDRGLWHKDLWLDFVRNPTPDFVAPIWDNGIDRKQLDAMLSDGLKRFYFRPAYIVQRLRNLHGFDELKKYVVGAFQLLRFKGAPR
jgi:anaerobic magnesium-protoporphyrin IX monomethyl ester cyclase